MMVQPLIFQGVHHGMESPKTDAFFSSHAFFRATWNCAWRFIRAAPRMVVRRPLEMMEHGIYNPTTNGPNGIYIFHLHQPISRSLIVGLYNSFISRDYYISLLYFIIFHQPILGINCINHLLLQPSGHMYFGEIWPYTPIWWYFTFTQISLIFTISTGWAIYIYLPYQLDGMIAKL